MAVVTLSPAFGITKTPRFNTIAQETAAMQNNVYVSAAAYPVWDFKISLPQITGRVDDPASNTAQLLDIFMTARGRAGTITLLDSQDCNVTSFQFGTGDGASQTFQLTRPVGTFVDIVQNINSITSVAINGTPTVAYAIDNKGVVTFNVAPAAAAVITWSGTFLWLLRFKSDSLADLTEFFSDKWSISTLELESVLR